MSNLNEIPFADDKEFASRSRAARGFSSFKDWARQNRAAFKDFNARSKKRGCTPQDAERYRRLMSTLDVEYMRLIRPNL
jgi:hypothetical protein